MSPSRKPSALWVTNIPAPYRRPLWAALSGLMDLSVICLAKSQPNQEFDSRIDVGEAQLTLLDVPCINAAGNSWYAPSLRLRQQLISCQPTAVYVDGWESPAYLQACLFARRRGIRLAIGYRGTRNSQRHRQGLVSMARKRVLALADVVVVAGEDSRLAALDAGVAGSKIRVAPNAADVAHYADLGHRRPPRESTAPHRVLYLGQLIDRKNVRAALAAWASVRQPHDSFTVAGSGPLRRSLEGQAKELGLEKFVHFVGHVTGNALDDVFLESDTLVLPSLEEVWGLVVNEALAAGLHVVVSHNAGVASSVRTMSGVFVVNVTEDGFAAGLAASRSLWTGPIENPAILAFTPERTAEIIAQALVR